MEGSIPSTDWLLAEAEERFGFRVVGGFPESSGLASPEVLAAALAGARASDGLVIADIGRISETTAKVTAGSDLVLLVVRADLVSVLGAERAFRQLEAAGTPRERILLVVSGHERRRPADLGEVGEALRLPVLASVPLDRRGARKALVSESPAATRRLRRAFDDLSAAVRRTLSESASGREPEVAGLTEVTT